MKQVRQSFRPCWLMAKVTVVLTNVGWDVKVKVHIVLRWAKCGAPCTAGGEILCVLNIVCIYCHKDWSENKRLSSNPAINHFKPFMLLYWCRLCKLEVLEIKKDFLCKKGTSRLLSAPWGFVFLFLCAGNSLGLRHHVFRFLRSSLVLRILSCDCCCTVWQSSLSVVCTFLSIYSLL